jgi:antitoxin ParD1/3/4
MATITIDLPPELDRIVHEQVASGLYSDAGDVIREALRRLDAEEAATQAELHAALAPAIADLDAGRVLDETILDILSSEEARRR